MSRGEIARRWAIQDSAKSKFGTKISKFQVNIEKPLETARGTQFHRAPAIKEGRLVTLIQSGFDTCTGRFSPIV